MSAPNFRVDVCVQAGTYSQLVLGLATRGRAVAAVGGQRVDLFLTSPDGAKFAPARSPGRGLRGAWLNEYGVWVVGEYGYAARSGDGGATWTPIKTGFHGCLFGIVEDGDGTFWMAGDVGFLARSTDGGATFKRVKGVGESIARISATSIGVLVPGDAPGHLYLAKGNKVTKLGLEAGVDLMNAAVTPKGTIVVVGAKGAAFRSEDDGVTFERIAMPETLLAGVDVLHDGRVIAVGAGGLVAVSNDDGKTFTAVSQHASNGMLWCVKRHGAGAIIGGQDGLVFRLIDANADDAANENPIATTTSKAPAGDVSAAPSLEASATQVRPEWRAPAPSTERQEWSLPALPVERIRGVFWTPELRYRLHPRRGGVKTAIRPLPTVSEAWARFRRAAWASDRTRMEAKKTPSGIWSWITSDSAVKRAIGERIADPSPRSGTLAEDAALTTLCYGGYSSFTYQFAEVLHESVVDFLVAQVGLAEAMRRAFVGLDDELPYSDVGPFGRLRELAVLADEPTYAEARRIAIETVAAEIAKTEAKSYVDKDRIADLRWAATFVFPITASMAADSEEHALHASALRHVGEFGNSRTHASGLASGRLDTLERFLQTSQKTGHQFFASDPRRFLASILDIDGAAALGTLLTMKPSPPFDKDVVYHLRWCQLLAHVDDDAALAKLLEERRGAGSTWGTASLLAAARFNFDRVMTVARAAGDGALIALLEGERGLEPEVPRLELEDVSLAALSTPCDYEPPTAIQPVTLAVPVALEPELVLRDEVPVDRDLRPKVEWNDGTLDGASAEASDAFVAHQEKWALPTTFDMLVVTPPRLQERLVARGFAFAGWQVRAWTPRLLLERGVSVVPALIAALQTPEMLEEALAAAQPVGDVSLVPTVAAAFAGKKNKPAARTWLLRHPRHGALGAVALIAADAEHADAVRVLRFLDSRGHRDLILDFAEKCSIAAHVRDLLDRDPLAAPKIKPPKLPSYASALDAGGLTRNDGQSVEKEDVARLLLELAFSNADEVHPGVLAAKRAYTPASRSRFVWTLFSAWLEAGADPKETWCMQALGHLGDDECARRLTKLAKEWPGEQASARAQAALDALVNIGSDVALSNIALLAEKSKFPKFKEAAKTRIDSIADSRSLTTDELADRLVPTLGLDEAGADRLDFGARKFRIGFDERLAPIVIDETGERHADLPKPGKADDKALAKEAKVKLAALKKDARTTASLQIARLERAMRSARRIEPVLFQDAFAQHPWMTHVAQRLVWAAVDRSRVEERVVPFRVAEDGTLADVEDRTYVLSREEIVAVRVLHPVHFPEGALAKWASIFADLKLLQPFPQLARPVFRPTDAERDAKSLTRFVGRAVTALALRGLESRGWERWVEDSIGFAKPLDGGGHATLFTGWHPSQPADDVEPQTMEAIQLERDRTLGSLDPIDFSELVLDVESILAAT